MKILFLDIDGVLNSDNTQERYLIGERRYVGIDPLLLSILKNIVDKTDCRIVLSSTWRNIPCALDEFKRNLKEAEIINSYIGMTINWDGRKTMMAESEPRSREIMEYVDSVKPDRFVAIDDVLLSLEGSNGLFLQTVEAVGITEEVAQKAIDFFNAEA